MTPEQERVSSILLDTVALLCKNSLSFTTELKVQGLIGITMDGSDIFLVQINELFHSEAAGSSVKQECVEVGAHQTPNPSQTFIERRAAPQKRQPAERKPMSRPLYSQSNRSNQMTEEVEAYHLNQNIKSEVGYDDPTSTFGEYGYAENTVMAPPTSSSSKVKPISMMRQTQVTYGSGASSSTVASTIVTEAFNMLDEGEEEEEEEGLCSQEDQMEQVDEMPKWDPTSGDGLYQHHLDQSQLNPVAPAAQMMWTGAMTTPRSSGFGFSHKVKHSMRGRGTPVMRGRQAMSAPSSARYKSSPSDPYVINETSHLCGYPNCGKRFRFRHDLLRHQTKKHGRMPVGRGRANRVQDFQDYE